MDLNDLRALNTVVELGSFVGAARRLGVSRPTLRRRLAALEAEVGVPLLVRTRAGSTPTEAGALLVERGRDLLRDGTALIAAAREVGDEPKGELRLVIPAGMAPPVVAALMAAMRTRYPRLSLRLQTASDPIAALEAGVDVAISFGDRRPGGRWVSMEIGRVRQRLVGTRAYLERHGTPVDVTELERHELLAWTPPGGNAARWPLHAGGYLEVNPVMVGPDIHLLREIAAAGLGLAFVPDADLEAPGPALIPVLADQLGAEHSLRIVVPASMEGLPRIRALLTEIRRLRALLPAGQADPSRAPVEQPPSG